MLTWQVCWRHFGDNVRPGLVVLHLYVSLFSNNNKQINKRGNGRGYCENALSQKETQIKAVW